ncbi:MAG TPA: diguanylate cyclase [Polyangiaceae bacterium]|jgi:diguanylate cyclase (GGDEF)-like protein|nr:diguanylate cyclase [Polyangiaceae bacterium]
MSLPSNPPELHVLIVDDDKTSRLLAAQALGEAGFKTLQAQDGREAIDLVLRQPEQIGVIVLDVLLPAMGGFQVLERLRKETRTRDIPVVLVTARANEEADVIHGINVGADDHVQKPFNGKILAAKVRALCERRRAAYTLSRRLRVAEELAATDPLTTLGNRRAFESQLQVEASFSARHSQPFALLALDLDHFKRVNDTFGHPAGDRVLQEVAQRIRASLRASDQAYRTGGEEFTVLLRGCDRQGALITAERVLAHVAATDIDAGTGTQLRLTLSGGIATMDSANGFASQGLIERADRALYRAKRLGRARVEVDSGQPLE